jgi:hypothetical protein
MHGHVASKGGSSYGARAHLVVVVNWHALVAGNTSEGKACTASHQPQQSAQAQQYIHRKKNSSNKGAHRSGQRGKFVSTGFSVLLSLFICVVFTATGAAASRRQCKYAAGGASDRANGQH